VGMEIILVDRIILFFDMVLKIEFSYIFHLDALVPVYEHSTKKNLVECDFSGGFCYALIKKIE
jgi:hypothetical protein